MSADNLTKEIRKAMIDADIKYETIGNGTASAWYQRIRDPWRMNLKTYSYLCQRLHVEPGELLKKVLR